MNHPIKVLCVDDSALMRKMLTSILSADPEIEVVGVAPDPLVARERIKRLSPDVLTLDVEMPKMDGLSFLEKVMRLRPMPVVMVSSLTERGAEASLRALELGAFEVVAKPKEDLARALPEIADELVRTVKAAAKARLIRPSPTGSKPSGPPCAAPRPSPGSPRRGDGRLIAIGASTGGTEAIREVLASFPPDAPPVVIAQHIPASFSAPFARRLDASSALQVTEATDGAWLERGAAYVAPGEHHLVIERSGDRYRARLSDAPRINRHRPSVDVLFRSVAAEAGPRALGILLTGMGEDGAAGLLELRRAGGVTFAQDELTSVVWGMPGHAVRIGAAEEILPLDRIAVRALDRVGA